MYWLNQQIEENVFEISFEVWGGQYVNVKSYCNGVERNKATFQLLEARNLYRNLMNRDYFKGRYQAKLGDLI